MGERLWEGLTTVVVVVVGCCYGLVVIGGYLNYSSYLNYNIKF